MAKNWVICFFCGKDFLKDNRHINENKKLGHKFYCSYKCQYIEKNKQKEIRCENPNCNNTFKRGSSYISPHNFCSRSCAAVVNNILFPKRVATIRKCTYCGKRMFKYGIYCSVRCSAEAHSISKEEAIDRIKEFYKNNGRIPVKKRNV